MNNLNKAFSFLKGNYKIIAFAILSFWILKGSLSNKVINDTIAHSREILNGADNIIPEIRSLADYLNRHDDRESYMSLYFDTLTLSNYIAEHVEKNAWAQIADKKDIGTPFTIATQHELLMASVAAFDNVFLWHYSIDMIIALLAIVLIASFLFDELVIRRHIKPRK